MGIGETLLRPDTKYFGDETKLSTENMECNTTVSNHGKKFAKVVFLMLVSSLIIIFSYQSATSSVKSRYIFCLFSNVAK